MLGLPGAGGQQVQVGVQDPGGAVGPLDVPARASTATRRSGSACGFLPSSHARPALSAGCPSAGCGGPCCCWPCWLRNRQRAAAPAGLGGCSKPGRSDRLITWVDRRPGPAAGSASWLPNSTQVSFEPPPCEELTTSSPSGNATRVSPPGSTQTELPLFTANGRRSTCRGRILSPISVGTVDSAISRWAIQPRGFSRMVALALARVSESACEPMTMPLPPDPSTGLRTSSARCSSAYSLVVGHLHPVGVHVEQDRLFAQVVPDDVRARRCRPACRRRCRCRPRWRWSGCRPWRR